MIDGMKDGHHEDKRDSCTHSGQYEHKYASYVITNDVLVVAAVLVHRLKIQIGNQLQYIVSNCAKIT